MLNNLKTNKIMKTTNELPKPFLSFKMKLFDDIINRTEKLANSGK